MKFCVDSGEKLSFAIKRSFSKLFGQENDGKPGMFNGMEFCGTRLTFPERWNLAVFL